MANEFHYSVSLSVVHPSMDVNWISRTLTTLRPRIAVTAGSEKRGKDGTPLVPSRKVALSHWLADLHQEERLFSGDRPLSDFLLEQASALAAYRDTFAELREEGQISFIIGWFSDKNHSAAMLGAETLQRCGELGIGIELDYYAPDE